MEDVVDVFEGLFEHVGAIPFVSTLSFFPAHMFRSYSTYTMNEICRQIANNLGLFKHDLASNYTKATSAKC